MQQRIRLEHDVGVTEGMLDHVDGTNIEVIDDEGQLQVLPSSAVLAFEFIVSPIDHSDELRGH